MRWNFLLDIFSSIIGWLFGRRNNSGARKIEWHYSEETKPDDDDD